MLTTKLRTLHGSELPFYNQTFRSSFKIKSPKYRLVLTKSNQLAPYRITYTTKPRDINVTELANLLSRCATYSPGHATNAADAHYSNSTLTTEADEEEVEHARRFQRRLRRALKNSLVCVAAYVPEASLPQHLHQSAEDLLPDNKNIKLKSQRFPPFVLPFLPIPGPKVLVGFARAVGDAALVATVHDIAVLPEMRGKGLGKILVEKLTDELYLRDIIDVGTVISEEETELFLKRCHFGEDSEDSVAMSLTEYGKTKWFLNGEKLVEEILNKKRPPKKKMNDPRNDGAAAAVKVDASISFPN